MNDLTLTLDLALHREKPRSQNDAAVLLEYLCSGRAAAHIRCALIFSVEHRAADPTHPNACAMERAQRCGRLFLHCGVRLRPSLRTMPPQRQGRSPQQLRS